MGTLQREGVGRAEDTEENANNNIPFSLPSPHWTFTDIRHFRVPYLLPCHARHLLNFRHTCQQSSCLPSCVVNNVQNVNAAQTGNKFANISLGSTWKLQTQQSTDIFSHTRLDRHPRNRIHRIIAAIRVHFIRQKEQQQEKRGRTAPPKTHSL